MSTQNNTKCLTRGIVSKFTTMDTLIKMRKCSRKIRKKINAKIHNNDKIIYTGIKLFDDS